MRPPRPSSRGFASRMATVSGGLASWHGQRQITLKEPMECRPLSRQLSCVSRQGGGGRPDAPADLTWEPWVAGAIQW
eukprot:1489270-Lingulodinium_polyedra.AAC.1